MTESQSFLLSLVRMALWGVHESLPVHTPDWKDVFNQAYRQTLLGIVADAVPMLPSDLQPDAQTRQKLYAVATKIALTHPLLNRKVADIKTRMDNIGINCVLLKGQGTALNYPNPQSRQCGDIDLYVGDENFIPVLKHLTPGREKNAAYYRTQKHIDITEDGISIEIHRVADILPGIRQNRLFQQWTENSLQSEALRKVEINGVSINLPPTDFDAIYIMNHTWHHFMVGGIGLRQICDWTMHMHRFHDQIDADALEENLSSFGLTQAWKVISCIAVKHLGLPEAECPLYDPSYAKKADKALEVIWDEGNFGIYSDSRKTRRPKGHFAGKFHSLKVSTSRIVNILSIAPSVVLHTWIWYCIKGMQNLLK